MQMVFDKIGSTAKPFKLDLEGALLEGTLQKSGYHQVTLDAQMSGSVELSCDRCGDTFDYDLDSKLKLKLSDQVSEDKDDLDIIEFLDGEIDISYILQSELNTLKSAYNYCDKCDNSDENFEMEF
ncbi:MAG: YceD family protein [Campylobacterota bacterium]|nr:YceD family protein [Campylobacterota bacterium]